MGKRYVDADILEDLAHNAGKTRGDLQELLRKCEGQVNSVVRRGWDQGAWADVRNTLGSELTSLDDHGRALVNRAGRVREAAAERALQQLRELWTAIAGLRQKISSEASWLKGFWDKWERRAESAMKRLLVLAALATLPPCFQVGVIITALSLRWEEALARLEADRKREEEQEREEAGKNQGDTHQTPPSNGIVVTIKASSTPDAFVTWGRDREGKRVDIDGYYGAQCVDLVMGAVGHLFGKPLTFRGNGPTGEWKAFGDTKQDHIFWNTNMWHKIPAGDIGKNGGYQAGDIIFFSGGKWAPGGHIGIVVEEKAGDLTVLEQNHLGEPIGEYHYYQSKGEWATIDGVIRYNPGE